MSKKVTVTYSVTYDLREGDVANDYLEWLDDYGDTSAQRAWFAIDRFVGHDNLKKFDSDASLHIEEEE